MEEQESCPAWSLVDTMPSDSPQPTAGRELCGKANIGVEIKQSANAGDECLILSGDLGRPIGDLRI